MKLLFVLPRMVMGGVERVTLNLIWRFQTEGVECALALRRCHGELLVEAEQLTKVYELAKGGIHQFIPRLAKLLRELQPTHVIVAFPDICLLTLWARNWAHCNAMVVYGVHNAHGIETAWPGLWGRLRYGIYRRIAGTVYRHVDAIVANSMGVEREIRALFGVPSNRVRMIYNPIIRKQDSGKLLRRAGSQNPTAFRLVAIGRLVPQKGFDILIDAMARIEEGLDWHLDIYGDGPERAALEAQVTTHRLSKRISLRGYTEDPVGCLCGADIFVLSSRHEGLPTVLILALACGMRIVSTDCPHGPREILCDGRLGVLVPPQDPLALANGILRAFSGHGLAGQAALQARAQDFTVDRSAALWRSLLESMTPVAA